MISFIWKIFSKKKKVEFIVRESRLEVTRGCGGAGERKRRC